MSRGTPAEPSFIDHLPLTSAAVAYAEELHAGQRRRSDGARFVLHPLEVASLLDRSGYPDHVVAAAVLHDVLEDTDSERSDLEARFGAEVADLVATVSDDPSIADEEERKADVRERVRRAGGNAVPVYAADKVSKVRELRALMARGIPAEEYAAKLARYERALAMLDEAAPGGRLTELLRFEIEALERLPPAPEEAA
ncbi:MAG: HD domain-containing protein [Thermoleophilaceae bacterium]|nr:HD domain-containing protein [Thermoleophilaceae bacterium]